jgi:hypothetical protein
LAIKFFLQAACQFHSRGGSISHPWTAFANKQLIPTVSATQGSNSLQRFFMTA